MKVKKDVPKIKKKKNKLESTIHSNIKKTKKTKLKKVKNNTEVAEAVKKDFTDSQKEAGSKEPLRQQTWFAYLKVFLASEKLNKKQTQIMEFCTNKSMTPPRRKQKFLRFIRNCFEHQKDVSDEQCNELFDLLLKKYDDYKTGKYSPVANNVSLDSAEPSTPKLSKNKKKKLRLSNHDSKIETDDVNTKTGGKKEKNKLKKKKRPKVSNESSNEDADVEMDE